MKVTYWTATGEENALLPKLMSMGLLSRKYLLIMNVRKISVSYSHLTAILRASIGTNRLVPY